MNGQYSTVADSTSREQSLTFRSLTEAGRMGANQRHAVASPLRPLPAAAAELSAAQQAAIEQQNRMKGWILEQEYYLEQNRLNGG